MKKFILLLMIIVSPALCAQNKVNIKLTNQELAVAMELFKKQTGMEFSYNPVAIDTRQKISIAIQDQGVDSAIDLLLGKNHTYIVKGKYIIITSEKKITKEPADLLADINKTKKEDNKHSGNIDDSCITIKGDKKIYLKNAESQNSFEINNYINNNKINDPMKLKKMASIIGLSALTLGQAHAQVKQVKQVKTPQKTVVFESALPKSPVQVSFIYPLSTDGAGSRNKEYTFSLNILGGFTGGVNGTEIGGLFNINEENQRGTQVAGIFNIVGKNSKGIQVAGIFNKVIGSSQGIQVAGVFNSAEDNSGAQIAGLFNHSSEQAKLQISGGANIAETVGTQIGLANKASTAKFQLGLVNITDTDDGVMLGLFNFVKEGGLFEVGISTNDYIYGAATLVTGTDKLYAIISAGVHSSTVAVGVGLGTRFQLKSSKGGINLELMHHQLLKNDFKKVDTNASLNQFKVLYSHRVNKVTYFAGPTINALLRDVEFMEVNKPIYSFIKNKGSRHDFNLWVGAELGMRFNFK